MKFKDIGHAQPVPDGIRVALDEKKARKLPQKKAKLFPETSTFFSSTFCLVISWGRKPQPLLLLYHLLEISNKYILLINCVVQDWEAIADDVQ